MPTRLVRARLLALLVAIPVAFALNSRASAQDPSLEVYYTRLEPKEQFKYKWRGKPALATAGVFRWEVPQSEFGTGGLDRNFSGYCAEVRVPIVAEKTYRFRMNSLYDVKNYEGLAADKEGVELAAQRRVIYIKELFGRYFRNPVQKPVTADEAIALQIALWEVIQEAEPAEGEPKFDLFGGDFQADYPRADAPASVKIAQEHLESLTGNDKLFYENPDLRGRELVRLQGIANAENVVAQSQFALRFVSGGGTSPAGLTGALTTGPGLGVVGGVGSPGAGVGGVGTGGGSGFLNTNGGNGITTTPTTTPTTPTTTTTTTPPTTTTTTPPLGGPPDTPPNGPPNQPPGTPGQQSFTPVPAPAGLVLGAIALGTLGAWRYGVRRLSSK